MILTHDMWMQDFVVVVLLLLLYSDVAHGLRLIRFVGTFVVSKYCILSEMQKSNLAVTGSTRIIGIVSLLICIDQEAYKLEYIWTFGCQRPEDTLVRSFPLQTRGPGFVS